MTDDNTVLTGVAEVRRLLEDVRRAREAFAAARSGSRSQYDAAFATLCKALARFNRRRGELVRALGLEDA